jgi:hypothetical protein
LSSLFFFFFVAMMLVILFWFYFSPSPDPSSFPVFYVLNYGPCRQESEIKQELASDNNGPAVWNPRFKEWEREMTLRYKNSTENSGWYGRKHVKSFSQNKPPQTSVPWLKTVGTAVISCLVACANFM